jgi:hypothetical protein
MFQPLNGPSLQDNVAVTDSVVFRVKSGGSELAERNVVTIYPLDGSIWVFFGDGTNTPSAANVKSKGFFHPIGSLRSYEAATTQEIYIVADTGTVDVRFAERA